MLKSLLILTLVSLSFSADISAMKATELVNDMGLGWNLGNNFDCFGDWAPIEKPDDQITMWGNVAPTKEMITNIKKYGFNTVRFPVTWQYFMDSKNTVSEEWMSRVKEVVDWVIDAGMYCILNIHHDGVSGNWLSQGKSAKDKFVTLWEQIATTFKDYDRHLVLESMNEVDYKNGNAYDYDTLVTLTQAFVDTVRKVGGGNKDRLLLISGANTNLEQTCNENYKMPKDSANMLAISIHYYLPPQFTVESDAEPWTWTDDQGVVHEITPLTKWGAEEDYKEMTANFESMKAAFTSKGIPVILGECGVLTEQKKDKDSIREFLYAEYSFSSDYDGIMTCLWDTSKNTAGDMNFYNRETDKWYDSGIQENFQKIAKGNYVHPKDYLITSNSETTTKIDADGNCQISIGTKKVQKVIFNADVNEDAIYNCGFGVASADSTGTWQGNPVGCGDGKKQDDGTYTYTIDFSNVDAHDYVQVQEWWGNEDIKINYATVEFASETLTIDYTKYKAAAK